MAFSVEDKFIFSILFDTCSKESFNSDIKNHIISPETKLNWEYIVLNASQEGISGVIYHNINKYCLREFIPQDVCRIFENHFYANLRRNMTITSELKSVLVLFKEAGIPCIVLKGIALAEHIYPSIAMRGMSDVDIMVKKGDLHTIDTILSCRGYVCRDGSVLNAINNPEGYLASLEYQRENESPLNLHIHWHIINSSVPATMFVKQVDNERIWGKALHAKVADADVRILCPEHLVIYLCEHALRIGHSFDRLILICDIFYAIKAYEKQIDWDIIAEESRRFNLDRFVFFSLSVVKFYSSLNIPAEYLRKQFSNRRIRGSSYFIYLAMNRTISNKITFIFRTFFPPAKILLQRQYIKDTEVKKSYYMYRIWEIMSYIFRIIIQQNVKTIKKSLT
jgi:hypothetical protein